MRSTGRSVVVVGAEGWLGGAVTRALREKLFGVVAVAESEGPRWHLEDLELTWEEGAPGREPLDRERVLAGAQALVLPLGENPPASSLETAGEAATARARRMRRLRGYLEVAERQGMRVILISSSATAVAALGQGPGPEPRHWTEEDRYCPGLSGRWELDDLMLQEEEVYRYIAGGLDAVILNPGALSGPGDCVAAGLEHLRKARALAPDRELAFCDVGDLAHGITHALVHARRGRRYLLSSAPITAENYVAAWEGGLGIREDRRAPGAADGAEDLLWWAAPVEARRAHHELGFRPRTTEKSVQEGARWLRQVGLFPTRPEGS